MRPLRAVGNIRLHIQLRVNGIKFSKQSINLPVKVIPFDILTSDKDFDGLNLGSQIFI